MRAHFLYGLGSFGGSLLQQTVLLWVFYFYAPPAGEGLPTRVAAPLLGMAMGAGRVVDALADPPVAYLSDRLRGRGGRRRPFILIGAPLLALAFALLWVPPHAGPTTANILYLGTVLGVFYLLYTVVMNPYTALLPEITAGGRGRIDTAAWQAGCSLAGTAAAFLGSSWLVGHSGFPTMGAVLAPIGMAAMWIAAFSVQERAVPEPAVAFGPAARAVVMNRAFQIYLLGLALLWFGLSMVNLSLAYVVTVLMGLSRQAVGAVLGATIGVSLLSFPLIAAMARRAGKRATLLRAMLMAGIVVPLMGLIGRLPLSLDPALQGYLLVILAGPPLAALFVLPNAILADIAEAHGARLGHRSEGLFFALQGLIFNGTTSLAAVALGVLLARFGFAVGADLGLRFVPLAAALSVAAGALVFTRFPRDERGAPTPPRPAASPGGRSRS
ncbi:MAG: MFS transporter [Armatimonadota bacterium]|nr:MFS transporter [Armatimonadota bacterium]MDR7451066.1 MFS transporter [Armatimonadota bacterium]MDR7465913.1 MFS transporter [Armatimonadota bacterium]MDR7493978.1 MFS transporter [Armatimonadota bacterium]MDR7498428.1 MFS transporter [Armatimonadota bacterium]